MSKDKEETIEVSGVIFSAEEVESAVIVKEGRKIHITEQEEEKRVGFAQ